MSLNFKRNIPLLAVTALVIALIVLSLGNTRIIAYTVPGSASAASAAQPEGSDVSNSVALFDDSIVHSLQIQMDGEDYTAMITAYEQNGDKEYFQADVIIDGVTISDVGVRLKGNASLRTALGGMGGGMGAFMDRGGRPAAAGEGQPAVRPDNFQPPEGFELPEGMQPPNGFEPPAAGEMPQQQEGEFAARQGMEANTQIPLLIKFDEFVAGQTYQGYDRVAVRSAGITYDASMLQEPLTYSVFSLMGLPAPETAYAGVSVNGEPEQLFTIAEVIEQEYITRHFENDNGVLYKAEVNATMSYQGEDPSAYANSFTQETRLNDADLDPLIEFLQFVSESDDETFASQLPNYLDVDSFAAYLAINAALVNNDALAGMGNNFYFYYDEVTGRMTVLVWDGNESLGKLAGGMGGGDAAEASVDVQSAGMGMRAGRGPGEAAAADASESSNSLLARFTANPAFKSLYQEKLEAVYQAAFAGGAVLDQLEAYTSVVRPAVSERALADTDAYEQAVGEVADFLTRRGEYLSGVLPLPGAN